METFNPPDLYSLLYCSHATSPLDSNNVWQIVTCAQRNNPQIEVTGLLMYGGGMFMQWLEGPRFQVRALMAKLRKDVRHDCITELHTFSGPSERLYPDWDMELVKPADICLVLHDARSQSANPLHHQAIDLLEQLLLTEQLQAIKPT